MDIKQKRRLLNEVKNGCCCIGNHSWYFQANSERLFLEVAGQLGITFDSCEPSPLGSRNGIIKAWAIGEWADAYPQHTDNDQVDRRGSELEVKHGYQD